MEILKKGKEVNNLPCCYDFLFHNFRFCVRFYNIIVKIRNKHCLYGLFCISLPKIRNKPPFLWIIPWFSPRKSVTSQQCFTMQSNHTTAVLSHAMSYVIMSVNELLSQLIFSDLYSKIKESISRSRITTQHNTIQSER